MKYIFLIIIAFFFQFTFAQQTENRFIATDKVNTLLVQRADCFEKNKTSLKFYHIQLYNGQNIDKARSVKARFKEDFPEIHAVVEWESPEFKVWVGEYENKLSADQALLRIKKKYPNAFIVNPKK